MIKKINAANWTGKEVTLRINKDTKTVRIVETEIDMKLVTKRQDGEKWIEVYYKYADESEWSEYPLCTMYKINNEWMATEMSVSREDEDPYVVAAQMAMNLI